MPQDRISPGSVIGASRRVPSRATSAPAARSRSARPALAPTASATRRARSSASSPASRMPRTVGGSRRADGIAAPQPARSTISVPSTTPAPGRAASVTSCISVDARPLEIAVEMALALEIAQLEQPGIATLRVGQNLPGIAVGIPEIKTIGAVLQHRLADLLQPPFLGLLDHDTVRLFDIRLGLDIEAVMVQQIHLGRALRIDDGIDMRPAQPDDQRDRAGAMDLEAEKLLIEFLGEVEIARFQRAVRQEIQLQRRLDFLRGRRGGVGDRHERSPSTFVVQKS